MDAAMNAGEEIALSQFAGDFTKNSPVSLRQQSMDRQYKPKAIYHYILKRSQCDRFVESLTVLLSDIYWPSNGKHPCGFPDARWTSDTFYAYESCIHSPAMLIKKIRFAPLVYRRENWLIDDAMTFLRERYVGVPSLPLPWEFPQSPPAPCTPLTCVYNAPAAPAPDAAAPPEVLDLFDPSDEEEKEEGEVSDDPPPPYQPLEEYEQPVIERDPPVVVQGRYAGTRQQRRYNALRPHPYSR